ncbi:S-layer homology domain-containing protein [Paenibacillus guangzhouensis]|uniref:S-layer homology domain-containing protein n=1 Tax=Paenibacillus guangzhouensis TaxID=1473112 RepID=UPI00187B41BA|nr:S-layer homology domain-containing protein [Paenibacillus guangzhouensis]
MSIGAIVGGAAVTEAASSSTNAAAATSETLIIPVEADKFTDQYGNYPDGLDVNGEPNILLVGYERDQSGDYGAANAALRFDLSNVPSGSKIESVKLKIYVKSVQKGGDIPYIDLWGSYNDNWNEDSSISFPSAHEAIIVKDRDVIENTWKAFDVTQFIKNRLSDQSMKATFVLKGRQTAPPAPLMYQSQILFYDKMKFPYRSQLEIIYTTLPINSPPTDITLSPNTIAENNKAGDRIGTLLAVDPEAGDTFTYSFASSAPFNIVGNTLLAAQVFDYETKSSYPVNIRVTDSAGNTFDKLLTVRITDVNEPPTDITLSSNTITENNQIGDTVGTLSATDPDTGDTFTYSLTPATSAPFTIVGNMLKAAQVFDYETQSSYLVSIRVTDSAGNTFDKLLTVRITDVNEPPTDITMSSNTITENNQIGDTVGTLSATDPDTADTFTYSLTPATSAPFTILGNMLKAAQVFDYETQSSYPVSIRVTDAAGNTFDKRFTVEIVDLNEPPTTATITINQGAVVTSSTNVSLELGHNDPDAAMPEFRFTNDAGGTWSAWTPFMTPVSWTLLDGDGTKTVYMELRDGTGIVLQASDSIVLDTTPPVVTGVMNSETYGSNVTIAFNEGTATLNGRPFNSGTNVSGDGDYVLVVTDAAGNTTTIIFTIDKISPAKSEISTKDATLVADGTSQTTVKVALRTSQGKPITTGGARVKIQSTLGTVGPVTDHQDGTYTVRLTAPSTPGEATIRASVDDNFIAATTEVRFTPWEVSLSRSTIITSDQVVRADGTRKASVRVSLKDERGVPIPGRQVQVQVDGGRSVIQAVYEMTNNDGVALFEVSNTAAERVTYSASERGGQPLDQTISITYTYDQPPSIVLQPDPSTPTFDSVSIAVTTAVYGAYNQIASVKWAQGSRDIAYFQHDGSEFIDRFSVLENGIYSVYARDAEGNENVSWIDIQNITAKSSNANLSSWQLSGTGGLLSIPFDPDITHYKAKASHAITGLKMSFTTADAYAVVYVNGMQVPSNVPPSEYTLVTGNNKFEINVKAQDGTLKTYRLEVNREGTETSIPSGPSSPSYSVSPSLPEKPANGVAIKINGRQVTGAATSRLEKDGSQSVEVLVARDMIISALDGQQFTMPSSILAITVANDQAGSVILRLPSDVVALLGNKVKTVALRTTIGNVDLPLTELVERNLGASGTESRIIIRPGSATELPGLKDAVVKIGASILGVPVHFELQMAQQGVVTDNITRFNQNVERVIFLPKDIDGKATTVAIWDPKRGIQPVPTSFRTVDGKQAAVIWSQSNSVVVLVSKSSTFVDTQGHWAMNEIAALSDRLIVQGVNANQFMPNKSITRAEFAALLARVLGLQEPDNGTAESFSDVPRSSWFSSAVHTVSANDMMNGLADGRFGPNLEITRQEAIVTIVRAMSFLQAASEEDNPADLSKYTDRDQVSPWASEAIRTAIAAGLIEGTGKQLEPQEQLTRAETSVLIYRLMQTSSRFAGEAGR